MLDPLFQILYRSPSLSEGLAALFPDPEFSLETFDVDPLSSAVASHCHALAYGNQIDALITGKNLIENYSSQIEKYSGALTRFQEEISLIQIACLHPPYLDYYLQGKPLRGAAGEVHWIQDLSRLKLLLQEKKHGPTGLFFERQQRIYKLMRDKIIYLSKPWVTIHYRPKPLPALPSSMIPVFFMEPLALDWKMLLSPYIAKPALFFFNDKATLFHCLQFPEVEAAFLDRKHLIYLAQIYPQEQLTIQPCYREFAQELHPVTFTEAASVLAPEICQALALCLKQQRHELTQDNAKADRLYRLSKELHYKRLLTQLGSHRFMGLRALRHQLDWNDPHKGASMPDEEGRLWDSHMENKLELFKAPVRRQIGKRDPIKIVHVTPQVVLGGHSPTKLLLALAAHHDRSRFIPSAYITERLVLRVSEYPIQPYASPSSIERGKEILEKLTLLGTEVIVDDATLCLQHTGARLAARLKLMKADVAVFHGPDEINLIASRLCDTPLKVLFEHGTLPRHAGFDLIISSTEDAAQRQASFYRSLNADIVALPFVLDLRAGWEPAPPRKESLGLPMHARTLTTISNHLEARLSDEMILTIATILRRCPDAYYCPMGRLKSPEKLLAKFRKHGVVERVLPLGNQANPGHLARCMDLYLNEFPFGSCIGMLEAMAVGCPPISMYDPEGPVQARYGGDYFGIDYAVTSCNPGDYANLACDLLNDHSLYQKWSQRARALYERRADVGAYVQKFEALILAKLGYELVASGPNDPKDFQTAYNR